MSSDVRVRGGMQRERFMQEHDGQLRRGVLRDDVQRHHDDMSGCHARLRPQRLLGDLHGLDARDDLRPELRLHRVLSRP